MDHHHVPRGLRPFVGDSDRLSLAKMSLVRVVETSVTTKRYRQPLSEKAQAVNDLLAEGGEWNVAEIEHRLGFRVDSQLRTLLNHGLVDCRWPEDVVMKVYRRWYHV